MLASTKMRISPLAPVGGEDAMNGGAWSAAGLDLRREIGGSAGLLRCRGRTTATHAKGRLPKLGFVL